MDPGSPPSCPSLPESWVALKAWHHVSIALAGRASLRVANGSVRADGLTGTVAVGDCGKWDSHPAPGVSLQTSRLGPPGLSSMLPPLPGDQGQRRKLSDWPGCAFARAQLSETRCSRPGVGAHSLSGSLAESEPPAPPSPWQSRVHGVGSTVPGDDCPHHVSFIGSSCHLLVSVADLGNPGVHSPALSGGAYNPRGARATEGQA